MFPLFETIRIHQQKIVHFEDHLARMKHSIKALSGRDLQFELNEKNILQEIKNDALLKCKILYNENDFEIEISNYEKRLIENIVFIHDDNISYPLKFVNRNCFLKHTQNLQTTTEPIFIVNGLLTDSSYSNIALWNGHEWHTPKEPLFFGVRRNILLNEFKIFEKEISINDIHQYQKISLINAMLDLGDLEINL